MSKTDTSKTHQEKAKAAIEKKASLGEDIDLTKYTDEDEKHVYRDDPSQLPAKAKTQMLDAGLATLADVSDVLAVWRALFDPGERVLLKV